MPAGPSAVYDLSGIARQVADLVAAGYDFSSDQSPFSSPASVRAALSAPDPQPSAELMATDESRNHTDT